MPDEFGEHLTRDQRPFLHTWSLQILQIHSSVLILSPLQFTIGFRSGNRGTFCAQWPIFVLILWSFWIIVLLEDPTTAHYKAFWPQDKQLSSCDPWRVFGHLNSLPHVALRQYGQTIYCRQICNISCWLELLNYGPNGGNVNVQCLNSFLFKTVAAHQKYILCFV